MAVATAMRPLIDLLAAELEARGLSTRSVQVYPPKLNYDCVCGEIRLVGVYDRYYSASHETGRHDEETIARWMAERIVMATAWTPGHTRAWKGEPDETVDVVHGLRFAFGCHYDEPDKPRVRFKR